MRAPLFLCALILATPLSAQSRGQSCSAAAPPTKPVNSEDYNPGLGGELGLNDDFHDDLWEPFDDPGKVISTLTREQAQDDEPGGIVLLHGFVGLNCSGEESR